MEVVRAETAGFCMGVSLALNKLDSLLEKGGASGGIITLGPIIHNPQVLEEYASKGVVTAENADDVTHDASAVIRAHGVPKSVQENLASRGVEVIDATCPKVKRAQLLIEKQAKDGRMLLLYGEESHPEVKGLLSYAEAGAFVFDSIDKLKGFPMKPNERYCLAAQTTQDRVNFGRLASWLENCEECDVTVLQTICDATKLRQEEAVRIARDVDYMVVVGGFMSGNTRRLAQVVAAEGTPCMHVETAKELPLKDLTGLSRIGLTAGASTPKQLVDDIQGILENL